MINSPRFIEQKGIRSLTDKDARVGYKSKTDSFFGYKAEYAMIPEERIISAVNVQDGAYVDGTKFRELYTRTKECGIEIKEAYGDKAYFRKPILDLLKEEKVSAYIPVSESVHKLDDTKFTYNKDSDQWFCEMGYGTTSKKRKGFMVWIVPEDTRFNLFYFPQMAVKTQNHLSFTDKKHDFFSAFEPSPLLYTSWHLNVNGRIFRKFIEYIEYKILLNRRYI